MRAYGLQLNPSITVVLWCSSARRQYQIATNPAQSATRLSRRSLLFAILASTWNRCWCLHDDACHRRRYRSCFAALRDEFEVFGVHYRDMPYSHWSALSWSVRLTTVGLYKRRYLDNFWGCSLSWMPLLDWSFRPGNLITYPRCYTSSTGCGSRIRSGSGYVSWCTAALRRHNADILSRRQPPSNGPHWRSSPSTLFRLRHVGRGTDDCDEPFNTRRPCFPSGSIKSVEWLAFLSHSQSRFVVSSGTKHL